MKRSKKKMPDDFNLYLLGDWHNGNVAFARERLVKDLAKIKRDKKGYIGLMGDLAEYIFLGDKRFATEIHAGKFQTADAQATDIRKILNPVMDRILWALKGNHEDKYEHIANISKMVFGDTDIVHDCFSVKMELTPKLKVFAIHGAGMVRSRAGDRKQVEVNDGITLKRKLKDLQGDCALMCMGHIHTVRMCIPQPHLMLVDDGEGGIKSVYPKASISPEGAIAPEDRYYCSTGSYLRGFMDNVTTYSEKAMYPPAEIGGVKVLVRDDEILEMQKWV